MADNTTPSTSTRLARLDQLTERNFHVFTVHLIDTDKEPITDNLRFTVTQAGASDGKEQTLAQGYVDHKGEFRFSVQTLKDADKPDSAKLPTVTIRILGLDEEELDKIRWELDSKKPEETVTIKADSLSVYHEKLEAPLAKLPDEVKPKDDSLKKFLGDLKNLEQLRTLKLPTDEADKLTATAKEEFRRLKSHAELQLLSRNAKINDALYKAGFPTITSIAETPRPDFLVKIKGAISVGLLDENRVRELHELAQRQVMVLHNIYIENAVNKVHRANAKAATQAGVDTPPQGCDCDCQSAVSPLAYLTDLLDYAITNVRRSGARLTFDDLIATFGQPFGDLPLDCAASETLVRQVRLCIEVLRAKLGNKQPNTTQYVQDAYEALLREIGTSRNELRATRLAPDNDNNGRKAQVAQKLGIDKTHLKDLLLEGIDLTNSNNPKNLTERNLERLFGLPDTTRDPLSVGAKFDDINNQIESWRLAGVEWLRNTNENGRIYVSLTKTGQAAQTRYSVQLYRDANRHELVASGESQVSSGPVDLVEEAGSSLRGRFRIKYQSDLEAGIAAVPEFLAWRLQALQQQWQETDWPTASLLDEPKLSIVDPDLLSNADFYQPFGQNQAHRLYVHRRKWVDDQRTRLDKVVANSNAACTVAEMLALMTQQTSYAARDGTRISVTPWTAPPDWQGIANDLQSANEAKVSPRLTELKQQRALSPETFAFLNATRALSNDELNKTPGDRDKVIDILLFVLKKKLYSVWRAEETNLAISLSPPFFLPHANGQLLHPLRLVPDHRALWERELERNTRIPVVDPDLIDPDWLSSDEVYDLHEERSKLCKYYYVALKPIDTLGELRNRLKDGNLQVTSGAQTVGQWHALGLTEDLIKASIAAAEKQRPLPLRLEQFGLATSEFLTLLEVWKLADVSPPLTDDRDWANVHHILLQAEKRRYLYPEWRKEERTDKIILSPYHFKLPENPLRRFLPPAPLMALGLEAVKWRFNSTLLREWRGILEPRFGQQQSASDSLSAAVDSVEEAILPALRNVLVDALVSNADAETSNSDPRRREKKKRYATNRYLINMADSGCRKTTRVAQAIETLQLLLWAIRTGQFEDKSFSLAPLKDQFDNEWQWLGSYATWRTAMFVFLYPENLLDPSWREKEEPDTQEVGEMLVTSLQEWIDSGYPTVFRPFGRQTILYQAIVQILSGVVQPSDNTSHDDETDRSATDDEGNQTLDPVAELAKLILARLSLTSAVSNTKTATAIYENLFALRDIAGDFYGVFAEGLRSRSGDAAEEDYVHIPLLFGLTLQKERDFIAALDWYRKVYDYDGTGSNEIVAKLFSLFGSSRSFVRDEDGWLEDELNPHKIGRTRADAYRRYILLSIVKCLIDYAESEFTIDTAESLARARENYDTALRLLEDAALKQTNAECEKFAGKLKITVGDYTYTPRDPRDYLDDQQIEAGEVDSLKDALDRIEKDPQMAFSAKRQEARKVVLSKLTYKPSRDAKTRVERLRAAKTRTFEKLLATLEIANGIRAIRLPKVSVTPPRRQAPSPVLARLRIPRPGSPTLDGLINTKHVPGTAFEFCIPRNPMVDILKRRAESGLLKLNNCMNIAGLKRDVPAYAAPTDTSTGLPMPSAGGTLQIQAANPQPTQYRYKALIERAKQLVGMAQQMEASYLSFLEKRDQEAYTLLKARQDLKIADANVTLQDLRLDEAEHQQDLADLQYDKVDFIRDYYEQLLSEDLLQTEQVALDSLRFAALAQTAGITEGAITGGGVFSATAQALSLISSFNAMYASFERQKQEWEFQRDLAEQFDLKIAEIQVDLAQDHYNIVEQEKRIAELGAQNASDVVNFLENKFTNAELYEWMSGIVGDIYRYFLQQATAMARMAQRQLAFERQEPETGFILTDYWTYTQTPSFFITEEGQDRRGMTGSARLLQDITKLDQHAFLSDQRRLQLSKTVSLAVLDPVAFHQFRETGVLPFGTPLEMFDRDFPGHFVRLIKRVRCTVVAVIPPIEGIKATLSTYGISRVVRGGVMFEEVEIKRLPDQVALTAPVNATGVFELQEQPEMLLPFEGNGLATSWEFQMPKAANRIDFNKIADVLITIDYTALHSDAYRDQVIQAMNPEISLARPFSFRHELADQWYDLHNSELDESPMEVEFKTQREDFALNLLDLKITEVSLYFACKSDFTDSITAELRFAEQNRAGSVGGSGSANGGAISSRLGNAGSWTAMQGKSPFGTWTLKFPSPDQNPDLAKDLFKKGYVEDILFVITYAGRTPDWPA